MKSRFETEFIDESCQANNSQIKIAIGDYMYTLNKEDLAFAPIGNGMSFGGIQPRGNLPFDILGDTFLKNVYAVFDVGRNRFGCVQRVDPDGSQSGTTA